jgi:hypothetical protein
LGPLGRPSDKKCAVGDFSAVCQRFVSGLSAVCRRWLYFNSF